MQDYDTWEIHSVVSVDNNDVKLHASLEDPDLVPEYVRHLFAIHMVKSVDIKFVKGCFN